ncbi:MAG: M15 family metallopeptidase [Bacilli bacterium]|nr:M15 family metallopeptidase [Bacilli bacterium]
MKNKYLILVNRNHKMTNEQNYEKVLCESIYAKDRTLEKKTYEQFLKLQKFVKENGYIIAIESGYRSSNLQQEIWDECLELYGLDYVKSFVALPGYSEHQTGLAVDYLIFDNGKFYEDQKMVNHPASKLIANNAYKFGFIIRYPKDKEHITGYGFEPWHLRYIDDVDIAKYIYDNNLCLEEYLIKKDDHKK